MQMARKKKMITLTLDPALVEQVDAWIKRQDFPPARNAVIEAALRQFLDASGSPKKPAKERA